MNLKYVIIMQNYNNTFDVSVHIWRNLMRNKKLFTAGLILMLITGVVGCGNDNKNNKENSILKTQEETSVVYKEETTASYNNRDKIEGTTDKNLQSSKAFYSVDLSNWKEIYLSAVDAGIISKVDALQGCWLIDVCNDGVPEIFIHGGSHMDYMIYLRKDGTIVQLSCPVQFYEENGKLYGYDEYGTAQQGYEKNAYYDYDAETGEFYKVRDLNMDMKNGVYTYTLDGVAIDKNEYDLLSEKSSSGTRKYAGDSRSDGNIVEAIKSYR